MLVTLRTSNYREFPSDGLHILTSGIPITSSLPSPDVHQPERLRRPPSMTSCAALRPLRLCLSYNVICLCRLQGSAMVPNILKNAEDRPWGALN